PACGLPDAAPQTTERAEAGEGEYEPMPGAADTEAAARLKPAVHDWPDNTTLPVSGSYGDVDKGFAQAEVVVSEKIRHPRMAGMALEGRAALAYHDADTGTLTVWSATQNPYSLRDSLAAVLELPAERSREV